MIFYLKSTVLKEKRSPIPTPLTQASSHTRVTAETARCRSKPGTKPCIPQNRNCVFRPPVKRTIKTRPREGKLSVLHYWKSALVPDERRGGTAKCHVTLKEVSERYKVSLKSKIVATLSCRDPPPSPAKCGNVESKSQNHGCLIDSHTPNSLIKILEARSPFPDVFYQEL